MRGEEVLTKHIPLGDGDYLGEGEDRAVPLFANGGRLEVDDRLSRGRVKTAAAEDALTSAEAVSPVPGRVYALVIGLGSEEFWGVNNNGDSFPEAGLLGQSPKGVPMAFFDRYAKRLPKSWGFRTFMKAHVFEEHKNSSPKFAIGGIHSTHWNPRMHRVENLIWVDRLKGKGWADKFDAGDNVGTSMACKVPFDRCSICGNLAPTRMQYCGHLKLGSPMYQLRQIRTDGKPVSMINDFPDFFDESCVKTPAAPEAMTIMKVAAEAKAAGKKEAEIKKEGPDLPLDVTLDDFNGLYRTEKKLPDVVLEKLSQLGLPVALKAASGLGMCLRPSEVFHVIFGAGAIAEKAAADLDRKVMLVEPRFDASLVDHLAKSARCEVAGDTPAVKVAQAVSLLRPFAPARSYQEPFLTPRLMKSASQPALFEPVTAMEHQLVDLYHAAYKAASGELGYGTTQAGLAWLGRHGGY